MGVRTIRCACDRGSRGQASVTLPPAATGLLGPPAGPTERLTLAPSVVPVTLGGTRWLVTCSVVRPPQGVDDGRFEGAPPPPEEEHPASTATARRAVSSERGTLVIIADGAAGGPGTH